MTSSAICPTCNLKMTGRWPDVFASMEAHKVQCDETFTSAVKGEKRKKKTFFTCPFDGIKLSTHKGVRTLILYVQEHMAAHRDRLARGMEKRRCGLCGGQERETGRVNLS
jgi:hypothetical protein